MSHPRDVEYARFFNRYPFESKQRRDNHSPEKKLLQRAGSPDLMTDSLRSLRVCSLSSKWDPLKTSASIAARVDTSNLRNHHIKFGTRCEADLIGISGANQVVSEALSAFLPRFYSIGLNWVSKTLLYLAQVCLMLVADSSPMSGVSHIAFFVLMSMHYHVL